MNIVLSNRSRKQAVQQLNETSAMDVIIGELCIADLEAHEIRIQTSDDRYEINMSIDEWNHINGMVTEEYNMQMTRTAALDRVRAAIACILHVCIDAGIEAGTEANEYCDGIDDDGDYETYLKMSYKEIAADYKLYQQHSK